MFSLVNRLLIEPLPYPESDRLVQLSETSPGLGTMGSSQARVLVPGLLLGLGLAWAVTRVLHATIPGIDSAGAARSMTIAVVLAFVAVALIASYLPARKVLGQPARDVLLQD